MLKPTGCSPRAWARLMVSKFLRSPSQTVCPCPPQGFGQIQSVRRFADVLAGAVKLENTHGKSYKRKSQKPKQIQSTPTVRSRDFYF